MKKLSALPLALSCLIAFSINAEQEEETPPTLAKKMSARVTVSATQQSLEEIITDIGQQANVSIQINWKALENIGVARDTHYDLTLKNVRATQATHAVLKFAQSSVKKGEEIIAIELGPQLWITSFKEALPHTETHTHDVRDLLHNIPDFTDAPEFDLEAIIGGESKHQVKNNNNASDAELSEEQKAEHLMDLVRLAISPDVWIANGGEHCSISYRNGNLVVTAPRFIHAELAGALKH